MFSKTSSLNTSLVWKYLHSVCFVISSLVGPSPRSLKQYSPFSSHYRSLQESHLPGHGLKQYEEPQCLSYLISVLSGRISVDNLPYQQFVTNGYYFSKHTFLILSYILRYIFSLTDKEPIFNKEIILM